MFRLSSIGHSMPLLRRVYIKGAMLMVIASIIGGCASTNAVQRQQYDFGLVDTKDVQGHQAEAGVMSGKKPFTIALAEIAVAPPLDSTTMWYRLNYDNGQQLKAYANARWSTPPAQLFAQRLKIQSVSSGLQLMTTNDSISGVPVLRIEIDEFSHVFNTLSDNHAHVSLRAMLTKGNVLLGQRQFTRQVAGKTADAAGGAHAMQEACDLVINDIQQWLTQVTTK